MLHPADVLDTPARRVGAGFAAAGLFLLLLVGFQLDAARDDLDAAKRDLERARDAVVDQDHDEAARRLDSAGRKIDAGEAKGRRFPLPLLRPVPVVGAPARAVTAGADAGREVISAARRLSEVAADLPIGGDAPTGEAEDPLAPPSKDLTEIRSAVLRSLEALDVADRHLARADARLAGPSGAVLPPVGRAAADLRASVGEAREQAEGLRRGLELFAELSDPATDARILLLSQDTLEIRPTGGYVGTWGLLRFAGGAVTLERFASYEDLPLATPPMTPPAGLDVALPRPWDIADTGWWPHFPYSAEVAREMFRRQGGGQVDGVVAITEHVLIRLVEVLGPIELPGYAPVVHEGLDERIVYEVELKKPLDVPRKRFMTMLADELFSRLEQMSEEDAPAVMRAFADSVGTGDIQVWFPDEARQAKVSGLAIAGEMPEPEGHDVVVMTDANLTASKANLGLTRQLTYRVERDAAGRIIARLEGTYSNDEEEHPKVNPYYNGHIRLRVPEGATPLPSKPGLTPLGRSDDGPFTEMSANVFVRPGETVSVRWAWVLPDTVAPDSRYRLVWRRQVGTLRDRVTLAVGSERVRCGTESLECTLEADLRRNRLRELVAR